MMLRSLGAFWLADKKPLSEFLKRATPLNVPTIELKSQTKSVGTATLLKLNSLSPPNNFEF